MKPKKCKICGIKESRYFHGKVCADCHMKYQAEYRKRPDAKERKRLINCRAYRRLRTEVLEALGGKCACCGEKHSEFLTIDHINNDGAEHRRLLKGDLKTMLAGIKKEGFPKDRYQVLCANCNHAKAYYGGCPHKKKI